LHLLDVEDDDDDDDDGDDGDFEMQRMWNVKAKVIP
jgi:hypothetical protein